MPLSRRHALLGLAALPLVAAVRPALAHRQRGVVTAIAWRDGELELTHRLHAHDALALVPADDAALVPADADIGSVAGLAHVALHVESNFALRADDIELSLDIVGAELVANDVYVYQAVRLPEPPRALAVRNRLLGDVVAVSAHTLTVSLDTGQTGTDIGVSDRWQTLPMP